MIDTNRLGLGTVQFGMDYGVSNPAGKVSRQEIRNIIMKSSKAGIEVLDTASAYGSAETVIGDTIAELDNPKFRIITKTISIEENETSLDAIIRTKEQFKKSLFKLRADKVDTLLIHNSENLTSKSGIELYHLLRELKDRGLINKIGISVYERDQIEKIFEKYNFDVIQLPVNIFDQRLISDGTLNELKKRGVEIHARSIFLQGSLLVKPDKTPLILKKITPHLKILHNDMQKYEIDMLSACLSFVLNIKEIDIALIGVTSEKELNEILNSKNVNYIDFSKYALHNKDLIDPRRW
jgi:aryl-alcohol dehydrogenase-like predicted oxidoreductase|tara:strand:- start:28962 stop:29846 length:885 start_codon:yes stop_codon:yes gene_type:complete